MQVYIALSPKEEWQKSFDDWKENKKGFLV